MMLMQHSSPPAMHPNCQFIINLQYFSFSDSEAEEAGKLPLEVEQHPNLEKP